ncbi:MAG TPA: hypothetical protein VMD56_13510 [Steroidobacteraceae bacterium]|nr:hypothetical protein [Steroidobacteraceae bacterium]
MASEKQTQPASELPSPAAGASVVAQPSVSSPSTSQGSAGLWAKIRRHKVVEWTLAYAAFGYALLHGVEIVGSAFDWSAAVARFTVFVLLLGIPVAGTLAYYQGHRAQHRVSRIEISILAALLVIAGSVLWFLSRSTHERAVAAITAATATMTAATPPVFAPPPHSIAVLPFTNLSGDPKQEYFSDGMTEELINALSQIDSLQVIARTSSFSFKGQNLDVGTIARKLNVGAILEGSIRRSGDTVRITAQLINASTGFHMWSEDYDRSLRNVLEVQSDIATSVAQQLQARLLGDEGANVELGATRNQQAHDAYLRGMQIISAGSDEAGYRKSLEFFSQALALDANYAMAYVGVASALSNIASHTDDLATREKAVAEAGRAAERAAALAPGLADAHLLLWTTRRLQLQMMSAVSELQRAIALAPGRAWVQFNVSQYEAILGQPESAVATIRHAIQLDPDNVIFRHELINDLTDAGRYREALEAIEDLRGLAPQSDQIAWYGAEVRLAQGQTESARRICEPASTPIRQDERHYCLALVYHALGEQPRAESELRRLQMTEGDTGPIDYAAIYAQWGDRQKALKWLSTAERLRDLGLGFLRTNWDLNPIRNEPEFKALERRLGFPP